jgi:hypothetical protein
MITGKKKHRTSLEETGTGKNNKELNFNPQIP